MNNTEQNDNNFEIVFYENSGDVRKSPKVQLAKKINRLISMTNSVFAMRPTAKKSKIKEITKDFNEIIEFMQNVYLELPTAATGLTLNSSIPGVNLMAEAADAESNQKINKLVVEYVNKDRQFYNRIPSSKNRITVPELISTKMNRPRILNDWIEKSLNALLMESTEERPNLDPKKLQKEVATSQTANQSSVDSQNSHQSRTNFGLFEIKEDPSSARSSLEKETTDETREHLENNLVQSNNALQHQLQEQQHQQQQLQQLQQPGLNEAPEILEELPEISDEDDQESELDIQRHKMPYVISEKKSRSRLWQQAFEKPEPICIKEVKFLKPCRSQIESDISLISERDHSFIVSKQVGGDISQSERVMDKSRVKIDRDINNAKVSGVRSNNKSSKDITHYSFQKNTPNPSKQIVNKKKVESVMSRRLTSHPEPNFGKFIPHHEKEKYHDSLKKLKHSLMFHG